MFAALRTQLPLATKSVSIRQFSSSSPALVKTLYVGNLSWATKDEDLRAAFAEFGEVSNSRVVTDRLSGRSRGFGFVDLVEDSAADVAIEEMNGKEFAGRDLVVNVSVPREADSFGGERKSYGSFNDRRGSDNRSSYSDDRSKRGGYRSDRGDRSYDRNDRSSGRGGREY